mgnify:CR=1 FL=1|tara:strand:- start:2378 stop:3016 length:639 start_codon:yes stop_codon:yes gene_type:complete
MPEETPKTYTEADIRERFVSKDVFQDRLQGKTTRISELETKLSEAQRVILEAQPRLARVDELSAELGKRDAAIQAAEDRVALARAGVTDDGAVGFLRMAFDQHVATLEEKPEDTAGAFRSWVGSEDGARANPYVGHLFNGMAPATAPPPAPAKAAPGLPPVSRASVETPPKAGGPLTQSQVKAEIGRIRGMTDSAEARAALAALRSRQLGQH